jgi:hypothetical protein
VIDFELESSGQLATWMVYPIAATGLLLPTCAQIFCPFPDLLQSPGRPTFWRDNNPAINSITYEMGILNARYGPGTFSQLYPHSCKIHISSNTSYANR